MAGDERHQEMYLAQALVNPNIPERVVDTKKPENTNEEALLNPGTAALSPETFFGAKLRDKERPADILLFHRAQYGDKELIVYLVETFLSQKCVIEDTCVILDNAIGIIKIDNSSKCYTPGKHFLIIEEVGRGFLGVVQKCIDFKSKQIFVMKTITISENNKRKAMASIRREVNTLLWCKSDHIIKLQGIHITDVTEFKLYLEYGGITMHQYFTRNLPDPTTLLNIVLQMLKGCNYLHHQGYVHTDLHLKNILINENPLQVRLCDMGSVKEVQESLFTESHGHTPDYFPPTVLKHWLNNLEIKVSQRLDTFAVGKLILEVCHHNHITTDEMIPYIYDQEQWKSFVSHTFLNATFTQFGNPPSLEYIKLTWLVLNLMSYQTTTDAARAISYITDEVQSQ